MSSMTALGNFLMTILPIIAFPAGMVFADWLRARNRHRIRAEYDWHMAETVEHESVEDIARRAI